MIYSSKKQCSSSLFVTKFAFSENNLSITSCVYTSKRNGRSQEVGRSISVGVRNIIGEGFYNVKKGDLRRI